MIRQIVCIAFSLTALFMFFGTCNAAGTLALEQTSKQKTCSFPKSPIKEQKLIELAKTEIQDREKTNRFTHFDVSWEKRLCAWIVTGSPENPGPGDERIMQFNNSGKLIRYAGGI